MFLAGSLMPDYFADKINLFVALAPAAATMHMPSLPIKLMAWLIKPLELLLVGGLHYWNWFAPVPTVLEGVLFLCDMPIFGFICKEFTKILHHEGVDDPKAAETFMSNEPSGASYR
jgi:hypothetical protein